MRWGGPRGGRFVALSLGAAGPFGDMCHFAACARFGLAIGDDSGGGIETGGDFGNVFAKQVFHLDIEEAVHRTKRPACDSADVLFELAGHCLLYTSPSPRDS